MGAGVGGIIGVGVCTGAGPVLVVMETFNTPDHMSNMKRIITPIIIQSAFIFFFKTLLFFKTIFFFYQSWNGKCNKKYNDQQPKLRL